MREKNPLNFKMLIVSINRNGGKNNLESLARMSHDQSFLIQHGKAQVAGYNEWPTQHKKKKKMSAMVYNLSAVLVRFNRNLFLTLRPLAQRKWEAKTTNEPVDGICFSPKLLSDMQVC